jgi:hypothetical protein
MRRPPRDPSNGVPAHARGDLRDDRTEQYRPCRFLHEQLAAASPDLLRSMLTTFIDALMSAEADALCGAGVWRTQPGAHLGLDLLARARLTTVPHTSIEGDHHGQHAGAQRLTNGSRVSRHTPHRWA